MDLAGRILFVDLGKGHNNDQGMFSLTGLKEYLEQHNIKILGDGGYSHYLIVKPDDDRSLAWNNLQKSLRSVVEIVLGLTKGWDFAESRVRVSTGLQEVILMNIFNFVAEKMQMYPRIVAQ